MPMIPEMIRSDPQKMVFDGLAANAIIQLTTKAQGMLNLFECVPDPITLTLFLIFRYPLLGSLVVNALLRIIFLQPADNDCD
jgi:hypothetical protein